MATKGLSRRELFESATAAAIAPAPAPPAIDFRYTPLASQAAFCFPDDPRKSLVSNQGELLYGHPGKGNAEYFPVTAGFDLNGMEPLRVVSQTMESAQIPVVRTKFDKPLALTTFATDSPRVDNVVISAPEGSTVAMIVRTRKPLTVDKTRVLIDGELFASSPVPLSVRDNGTHYRLTFPFGQGAKNLRVCFGGESTATEEDARVWWRKWRPFGGEVDWKLPKPYQDFLVACARNIQQARELRNGKLTFQVGPTCYRGLWVVDGHFILEAARYLGYDSEARQGLHTTWTYQRPDGALDAGGGPEHYKDTAIAMFSTARQCELSQDWSDFDTLKPKILRGIEFLRAIRQKGFEEGSPAGKAGVFARGFADGGIGKGSEFTNPLWSCAGLKSVAGRVPEAAALYKELRASLDAAARQQMVRHPAGFGYLPMVFREDPLWQDPDPNRRPLAQSAQWALSHAIYPGVIFTPDDPVVRGHVRLMQWCTKEDVPVESGWLHVNGLWTYNAAFAAHAYLWAGESDWARRTFRGFLNHATPLWCWREEQPLRGTSASGYVGDMPHNWASAECVLYLRHMLALEDGDTLRLLDGVGPEDLAYGEPFVLKNTPTRFGRLDLELEPARGRWQLRYKLRGGPAPSRVIVNRNLAVTVVTV